MASATKSNVRVLPKAVPAQLPCGHRRGEICDACIMWSGIRGSGWIDPRFWRAGAKGAYIVTATCLAHGMMGATVEVATHRDPMTCLERAARKVLHGGRFSCGCRTMKE